MHGDDVSVLAFTDGAAAPAVCGQLAADQKALSPLSPQVPTTIHVIYFIILIGTIKSHDNLYTRFAYVVACPPSRASILDMDDRGGALAGAH